MSHSKLKEYVFIRANGLCEYCKSPADISSQPFVIEHIVPKSKGGKTELNNLALACQGCNSYKYNKTESIDTITGNTFQLYNPRINTWNESFEWSNDVTEIFGINGSGRITVDVLKLNRKELVNLRKLLDSVGKHPPKE